MTLSRKPRSSSLPCYATNKIPQRCHFYLKGHCKWGNFCRYQHGIAYKPKPMRYMPKPQPDHINFRPPLQLGLTLPEYIPEYKYKLDQIRQALRQQQLS